MMILVLDHTTSNAITILLKNLFSQITILHLEILGVFNRIIRLESVKILTKFVVLILNRCRFEFQLLKIHHGVYLLGSVTNFSTVTRLRVRVMMLRRALEFDVILISWRLLWWLTSSELTVFVSAENLHLPCLSCHTSVGRVIDLRILYNLLDVLIRHEWRLDI